MRELQSQRRGRRLLRGRQSRKASRLEGSARSEIGRGVKWRGRKVWKGGKALNGKREQDLSTGGGKQGAAESERGQGTEVRQTRVREPRGAAGLVTGQ